MKKIGIMQPYFLPYIGYFQLINHADTFVLHDGLKYTKKGWINRNRIADALGEIKTISINLEKSSDFSLIREKKISNSFDRHRLLRVLDNNYKRAPHFESLRPTLEEIVLFETESMSLYLEHSIEKLLGFLSIETVLFSARQVSHNPQLTSSDLVMDIVSGVGGTHYINMEGGRDLYSKREFKIHNIDLKFLRPDLAQLPADERGVTDGTLSIIDLIAYRGLERVKELLNRFNLS